MKKKKLIISLIVILVIIALIVCFIILKNKKNKHNQELEILNKYNEIQIYLNVGLNDEDIKNVKEKLEKIKEITISKFISKQDALDEMKERFGDKASLLDEYHADILPVSFIIKYDIGKLIDNEEKYQELVEKIEGINGVNTVSSSYKMIKEIYIKGVLIEFDEFNELTDKLTKANTIEEKNEINKRLDALKLIITSKTGESLKKD